ncbi:MAG TPA: ammonia channel protein, partial [Desulfoprunum sp.]|nr:ammonia channel protein [Desulfoprunum sp.]
ALVCAIVIGKRRGYGRDAIHPNNLPMTVLGAAILWFGWFGFNAGSALTAGPIAALALMTTQLATGVGALGWVLAEWKIQGKPTTLGAASGAVAGLVAITPGCGFVTPVWAVVIGGVAGVLCYLGIILKSKIGYDDALDVVAVHGLGGLWGALATGIFASVGAKGLLYGNPHQLTVQAIGAGAAIVYSVVVTFVILKVIDAIVGLRVDSEGEQQGLDVVEHSEVGYSI